VPPNVETTGVLVKRVNVFDDEAGREVMNICVERCGFNPSEA